MCHFFCASLACSGGRTRIVFVSAGLHVRRISNESGIALPKEFVLLRLLLFLAEIIAKHACIAARARADFVTDFLRASISFASCGLHDAFVA
jgi:hypothetical protein